MNQEPSTHEKVLGALEDASMYQDLGSDARERAAGAKSAWSMLRDRLNTVTQDHQTWRDGHKVSAWLHDNGWWKSGELAHHEDRQRRYTSREADAHIAHVNARDEVRRLDKNLVHSQDQASAGWRQLEQEREQQEKAVQQRQEPATASRVQQHEQASPSQTTARRHDPADRFTGALELYNAGHPTQEPLQREAGESALHMAQDPEVARRLVLAGADVNFNAGTQKEPLGVTQEWRDDVETGERGRVSKGTEFEHAIQSATEQRQQTMQTQAFGSVELPRTKQEQQQEQSRPNVGQRVMQNNVELPQPGRRPSLGEAALIALQKTQQQGQDDQGQGSGGRHGGQERPSHSSFYQPIPVGGMAPPNADERSAAIQQQEKARRRSLSRSF